jgi:SAM-dependent methyltransferase
MGILRALLAHPLTRGLDIDSPDTTRIRRQIVREKAFLRRLYDEWYRMIAAALPPGAGTVVELGSGAGFLDEYIDGLVTSEVFPTPGAQIVIDGTRLPFGDGSLRAIVMTDVFHHIARPRAFLAEAQRSLRPRGRIVMVEPWVTPWSRLIYQNLHHEPFRPDAAEWEFPSSGPLSSANGALPWIVFERDRTVFEREYPGLGTVQVRPFMPLAYLVSGGVALRTLLPGWSYPVLRAAERLTAESAMAMFAFITVERRDTGAAGVRRP